MPTMGGGHSMPITAKSLFLDEGGPIDVPFERFTDDWIERPIFERFEHVVARCGDKIAVDDGLVRYTYRELLRISAHLALRIDALVSPQAPVGILLPNCALVPIAALACLAVNRPFVPMDRDFPALRNQQIIVEAGLRAVIGDGVSTDGINAATPITYIDITSSFAADAADTKVPIATATGPALILYTSGSTGRPKGTCHDQRSVSYCVAQLTNSCHLNADDRIILLNKAGTVVGIRNMFAALLNGATLFIADPRGVGIHGVLRTLQDQRITFCNVVPTLLRELVKAKEAKRAFANLRVVRLGGENIRSRDVEMLRVVVPPSCYIQLSYGLTESASIFQWFTPSNWSFDGPRMPCGYSVPDQSIWLTQEPGASSSCGELIVKSRYLALGYWQNGSLQQQSFEQDPDDPSLRILRTGDLVQLRDDGLAEIIGRKDRQVKINGLPVNPSEVEDVLCRCDGVSEAVVTSRRDNRDVAALIAFVVLSRPAGASFINDLRDDIASRLPGYMRPAHILVVDKIPLLPRFKPDIAALERFAESVIATGGTRENSGEPSAQRRRIEDVVSHAWKSVLGQQSFQANMRWYQAGGDSLKKIRLWLDVEKSLGIRLPFETFDDRATLDDIVANVEKAMSVLQPAPD